MKVLGYLLLFTFTLQVSTMISQTRNLIKEDLNEQFLISDKATTHLIFNDEVDYVDIGSAEFAAEKLKNIVKLKFVGTGIYNTTQFSNITVITYGGSYYSLNIAFDPYKGPSMNNTYVLKDSLLNLNAFNKHREDAQVLQNCQNLLLKASNFRRSYRDRKMEYKVDGIFYEQDKIIFRLMIKNRSMINYTIDSTRFWLKNRGNPNIPKLRVLRKNKAVQYLEKYTDFNCYNKDNEISGFSEKWMLFAFNRFVPTEDQVLEILITESNGGGRRGKLVLNINDFLLKK